MVVILKAVINGFWLFSSFTHVGMLKIEVLMVDSGVKKALAESGFCSIGLLLWVRVCVLAICPLWVLVVEWYLRGYLASFFLGMEGVT
jgi:hypothetical protein